MQAMISAIQNEYQLCEMPKIFIKIQRQGMVEFLISETITVILAIAYLGAAEKITDNV